MSSAAGNLTIPERRRFPRGGPLMVVPDETTWRTLVVFCVYRVVLAAFVGGAFIFLNRFFNLGIVTPGAVVPTVVTYTLASVLLLIPARLREPSLMLQVTAGVIVDVLAIVMLMYASGGVRSGLGVILLVSLAAAGLITRGRLAFFHAAIAALAVLLEQTFQVWRYDAGINDFVQAGLTAAAFFATAGLASKLASYARTSEEIAEERRLDLANLSQINELVIRDMQDAILVVDGQGRIRQSNPRAGQMLGPLPVGRTAALSDYAPEIAGLLDSWRKGSEATYMPLRSPRVAGELQVHFVPIGAGDPPPTVVFIADVGRQRQQALQMKLVALGRLTASIAHEIRNPLSSIGHAAELLEEDSAMGESSRRLIDIIAGNVTRLDRIVQEILDLNRRDRAQPEAIDANAFLSHFAAEFTANQKIPLESLDVQVRTTYRPWFDRQHLDQILWNLARNAWRHGRRLPGSVRIVIAPSPAPGRLTLDVIDDGPGVSREIQAHLFEPFFTTEAQGTGLGLYIARELCEGNGAHIEYVDDGSGHFRIHLKGA
ncbi:MAG: PAS domain-containing protein [Burkholderiales bacterium]|nr:PAS domain-containing protein [Burkholderiales bacterium]